MSDSNALRTWLERSGHTLSGRGTWALGKEPGSPDGAGFSRADLTVLVVRLSPYAHVALSTSHHLVAALFREAGERCGSTLFADTAFMPTPRDGRLLVEAGLPLLFGTASHQRAAAFDLVALSCSHPSEFLNIPWLLDGSQIPLSRKERLEEASCPLVILGGAASSHTAPLHGDARGRGSGGLVDGVVVGEGEKAIPDLVRLLAGRPDEPLDRAAFLVRARQEVPGFYDPAAYRHTHAASGRGELEAVEPLSEEVPFPVRRAVTTPMPASDPESSFVIPFSTDAAGKASVEISRGCPFFCAFCREGYDQRPYRERGVEEMEAAMLRAKAGLGADQVNLASFSFNMHSEIYPLLLSAGRLFHTVRAKSQRFDILARNPESAEIAARLGKRVFTLGLEGISERIRSFCGKEIRRDQVLAAARAIAWARASELKIFVIATGLEKGADLGEFRSLLSELRNDAAGPGRGAFRIVVSLTPLIVQPHTPFQFLGRGIRPGRFEKVRSSLRALCADCGVEFRAAASVREINTLQLLAVGDRRLTPALVEASLRDLALYCDSIPDNAEAALQRALESRGIDPGSIGAVPEGGGLEAIRSKGRCKEDGQTVFPWADISAGVPESFLESRFHAALAFRSEGHCLGSEKREGECPACGACPDRDTIAAITKKRWCVPPTPHDLDQIEKGRSAPVPFTFQVRLDDGLRFVPRPCLPRALARSLMLEEPALVPWYLGPGKVSGSPYRYSAGLMEVELFFRNSIPARCLDLLQEEDLLARSSKRWLPLAVVGARCGSEAKQPESPYDYTLIFPRGTDPSRVARAVCRPGKGRPLPLTQYSLSHGFELKPEGKKSRSSPVAGASVEKDETGEVRLRLSCRPSFDPGTIPASFLDGDDIFKVIIRREL